MKNTAELSFHTIYAWCFRNNLFFAIIMLLLTTLLLFFTQTLEIGMSCLLVYLVGFLGSVSIHEYLHIVFMRRFGVKTVKISYGIWKASITTEENLTGANLIQTAVLGPAVTFLIGLCGMFFSRQCDSGIIEVISGIYMFHIVNVIPPLGDGKMILKGILTVKNGKGSRKRYEK